MGIPSIKDDELLIRVKACALSDTDIKMREGGFKELFQLSESNPLIPGYEISGSVERVGTQFIKQFKMGDQVVVLSSLDNYYGGCAEFTVQNALNVGEKFEYF